MNIDIKDWDEVLNIESSIEQEGEIFTISIIFINGEVLTYGYLDKKEWFKDCSVLFSKLSRRV